MQYNYVTGYAKGERDILLDIQNILKTNSVDSAIDAVNQYVAEKLNSKLIDMVKTMPTYENFDDRISKIREAMKESLEIYKEIYHA